jgi:hypothetical protein
MTLGATSKRRLGCERRRRSRAGRRGRSATLGAVIGRHRLPAQVIPLAWQTLQDIPRPPNTAERLCECPLDAQ